MRRLIWTDSGVKERGDNRMEQILQTRNVPVTGEYDRSEERRVGKECR